MKKAKIHNKITEDAKEREKKWKDLRGFMEKYEENKPTRKNASEVLKIIEKNENEVDVFLKSIGLEKYSDLMRENGIDDLEIVQELTEPHLEQLGIVLGHRIKILKKIKEMSEPEVKSPQRSVPLTSLVKKENEIKLPQKVQYEPAFIKPAKIEPTPQVKTSKKSESTDMGTDAISEEKPLPKGFSERTIEVSGTKPGKVPLDSSKPPIVQMQKVPMASKPPTVGKTMATYQPMPVDSEKELKLSEIVEIKNLTEPNEEIKWDTFTYLPYKPSEEIQASITQRSNSRPTSAKLENKSASKTIEKPAIPQRENFEVAGWDN